MLRVKLHTYRIVCCIVQPLVYRTFRPTPSHSPFTKSQLRPTSRAWYCAVRVLGRDWLILLSIWSALNSLQSGKMWTDVGWALSPFGLSSRPLDIFLQWGCSPFFYMLELPLSLSYFPLLSGLISWGRRHILLLEWLFHSCESDTCFVGSVALSISCIPSVL